MINLALLWRLSPVLLTAGGWREATASCEALHLCSSRIARALKALAAARQTSQPGRGCRIASHRRCKLKGCLDTPVEQYHRAGAQICSQSTDRQLKQTHACLYTVPAFHEANGRLAGEARWRGDKPMRRSSRNRRLTSCAGSSFEAKLQVAARVTHARKQQSS